MKKIASIIVLTLLLFSCNNDDSSGNMNCELQSEVVNEEFNQIQTSNYSINNVNLVDDCLEITYSSSGCDSNNWQEEMYGYIGVLSIGDNGIDARNLKMKLINNETCAAVFEKTVSFNITPFQIDSDNQIYLYLEGWNETIHYTY